MTDDNAGQMVDSGRDYTHILDWFRETKGVGIAPTHIVLALRDLDASRAEVLRLRGDYDRAEAARTYEAACRAKAERTP